MASSFTGERMVPGISPKRIEDDHLARYRFATRYVRNKSVLDIAYGTGYGTRMLLDGGDMPRIDGEGIVYCDHQTHNCIRSVFAYMDHRRHKARTLWGVGKYRRCSWSL